MATFRASQRNRMILQRAFILLAVFLLSSTPHAASAADAAPDDRAVPYYTGTVYPTPQQAQYRDEFLPLASVGLLLGKDVKPEDPRVAVLVERLRRNGAQPRVVVSAEDRSETLILVGETGAHESMLGKLAGHSMFQGAAAERLKMCGDCRVIDIYSADNEAKITEL